MKTKEELAAEDLATKKTGFDFDAQMWAHKLCEIWSPEFFSTKARMTLMVMARACKPHHQCFLGLETIARRCGFADVRTAKGAISELEDLEVLSKTAREGQCYVFFLHLWAVSSEQSPPPLTEDGLMDDYAPVAPPEILEGVGHYTTTPWLALHKEGRMDPWYDLLTERSQEHTEKLRQQKQWKKAQKDKAAEEAA